MLRIVNGAPSVPAPVETSQHQLRLVCFMYMLTSLGLRVEYPDESEDYIRLDELNDDEIILLPLGD